MRMSLRSIRLGAAVALVSLSLASCGEKSDDVVKRGTTFLRLKLKNSSPVPPAPGGKPATATATGTQTGRTTPTPPMTTPSANPGQTVQSAPPGTSEVDAVSITVSFTGGKTLTGSGSYGVGYFIEFVDIDATEAGGTATVRFGSLQPNQTIPLVAN